MAEFRLTRRDALAAAAAAAGSVALSEIAVDGSSASDAELSDHEIVTAEAVAEVVYPSAVEVTTVFVETYLRRLDPERTAGVVAAVAALDDATRRRQGKPFAAVESEDQRERLLRSLGVDRAVSAADGTIAERVRYHLVNSLLYALFSSPAGSRLVGIDNPIGHPGGAYSYES